ncbi:hypothetical protein L7F22_053099 [Adiantum nelumboides]|nr:hypothetical protein [Adiantum nelumboides]
MQMRALQDWETGRLICKNDNHKRIVYNMKEQQQKNIQVESTPSDTEEEFSTTASEEDSNITTEEDSSMEVMGIRLRPVNKEQASQVEEEVKEQPQEHNEEMIEARESTTSSKATKTGGGEEGVVKEEALLKEVRKLLSAGFIYPVDNFEWVSPVVVTPKKNGKWRVCVDYRPLNEATKRDHFPLPFQDEILNEVARHEKYTVCYGYSGYFQIRIAKEDQKKTTFITPWGCYAFWVMPFGLTSAPATFQRFMNHVFQAFFGKSIRVYIDDFCIYSSKALHVQKVEEGLQRLNGFAGQLNPDKCHIREDEVILLGHKISQRGIEVDPAKAKALLELPSPKSIKEVTSFMQKVKYMARFIHLASELLHPLQKLTQQVEFAWSEDLEEYFKSIKNGFV